MLDELNEKEMNDPRVQAMFKRSRHNNLSIFIFSQDLYQDKASMDMNLNEFKYLTSTCWNKNYQHLTIDMTNDK